jgi:MarR family transcriptional regulator for hemolysin
MAPPVRTPLGLDLAMTAKVTGRAFDDAMEAAGGSRPTWLVLLALKSGGAARNQREIADAVGIQGATLTHHLNAMESAGLVTRRRDDANRRVHVVELTAAGEELFLTLRGAAAAFDKRLRRGMGEEEDAALRASLQRLRENVAG